jgi:hypothetical protein
MAGRQFGALTCRCLFTIANLHHGMVWLPYVLILAVLVAAHIVLRAVRYQRRRARANRTAKPG